VKIKTFADIEAMSIESLWPGFIPYSEPTFLVGTGGVGKGMLVSDLVARVTNGDAMPDGSHSDMPAGNVILIQPEDDANTAVVQRLRAARADLARVIPFEDGFSLPESIPALKALCESVGDVRMIVIDPLSAVSSVALSSGPVKIRSITNALEALAGDTGAAVLIVHHFTKAGHKQGAAGISGSKVWTDAARIVLSVSKSEIDPKVRNIEVLKSNISSDMRIVSYVIEQRESEEVPHVVFLDDQSERGAPAINTTERVYQLLALAAEPMNGQQVANALRLTYGNAHVALHRLVKTGRVTRPERGLYAAVLVKLAIES
jgi:predicted ATP-dependent serine protease